MKKFTILLAVLLLLTFTNYAQWSDDPTENTAVVIAEGEQTIPKIATHPNGTSYVGWFSNEGGNITSDYKNSMFMVTSNGMLQDYW